MTVAAPLRPYSPKSLTAMIGAPLLTIGTLAAVVLAPAVSAQSITTTAVNCDTGDSLATAVAEAGPGTTIQVSGTCDESVHIPRTVNNLVIDGDGNATVQGPDASAPPTGPGSFTFSIEGQGITLQDLTISGGAHGVHLSGPASTTIVDNTITDNDGPGIVIKQWSTGWASGNTIADNQGDGILLSNGSGLSLTPEGAEAPSQVASNHTYPAAPTVAPASPAPSAATSTATPAPSTAQTVQRASPRAA